MSAATWILCSKIVLISIGAISIAMAVKFSLPSIMAFAFDDLPTFWSSLVSWLKPPYLYFIVNGIIITIVASSRFNQKVENSESSQTQPLITPKTVPPAHVVAADMPVQPMPEINAVETPPQIAYVAEDEQVANIVELKPVVVNGVIEAIENETYDVQSDDDDRVVSKSRWSPPESDDVDDYGLVVSKSACASPRKTISPHAQLDYILLPVERKSLNPSRFGHRKPIKVIPEGRRAGRVARPKRYETMENTWKKIMEGRERQLEKSNTFENHSGGVDMNTADDYEDNNDNDEEELVPRHVLKSATFRDRTNYDDADGRAPPAPAVPALDWSSNMGKIKKELSLGQDELNRRVEAFIKKFNEDMRLQRQESINQYLEMINRGAN